MTWKHHRIWIIIVLALSGAVIAWLMLTTPPDASNTQAIEQLPAASDLSGRAIYTNGEYGFAITYPETARIEERFSNEYNLSSMWRTTALPNSTGTPIVSIVGYSTVSDHSYPRQWSAQIRIGASRDLLEKAACLMADANKGEQVLPDLVQNGTTWKAFSFGDAGMMQYVRGVSYRTMHEGACIALEKIQSGSNYRDDPKSIDDIEDEMLQVRYQNLDSIVESFSFARP